METRVVIAYGLLLGIAIVGTVWGVVHSRRRAARRRRLRGIKSYNAGARN